MYCSTRLVDSTYIFFKMAVSNQNLIVMKLKQLFYDIRVDHLAEDELDFELEVRKIVFSDNEAIARKRRALR